MFALPGRQAKWMSRNSRRRRLVKEFEINFLIQKLAKFGKYTQPGTQPLMFDKHLKG